MGYREPTRIPRVVVFVLAVVVASCGGGPGAGDTVTAYVLSTNP